MQVAHALPEDARAVAEIHVNAWRAAYASLIPGEYLAALSVEHREAMWGQYIAAGIPELLVAKDRGVVQGWISFSRSRDDGASESEAELRALYVSPVSWSTGVGRRLWLHTKDLMIRQAYRSCSLWVFPENDRAIRFYRAAGFVADPSSSKSLELGGKQLQEVRYMLRLDH